MGWRDRAVCAGVDVDLFYPEGTESGWEALEFCGRCPVRSECLSDALVTGEVFGIRGGMLARDRAALEEG